MNCTKCGVTLNADTTCPSCSFGSFASTDFEEIKFQDTSFDSSVEEYTPTPLPAPEPEPVEKPEPVSGPVPKLEPVSVPEPVPDFEPILEPVPVSESAPEPEPTLEQIPKAESVQEPKLPPPPPPETTIPQPVLLVEPTPVLGGDFMLQADPSKLYMPQIACDKFTMGSISIAQMEEAPKPTTLGERGYDTAALNAMRRAETPVYTQPPQLAMYSPELQQIEHKSFTKIVFESIWFAICLPFKALLYLGNLTDDDLHRRRRRGRW
jgi:hypothetical protein